MPITKKILLLAYYYEPCAYVAANRPNSFATELAKNGYEVIVVTRHWTGWEQSWSDYLAANNSTAIIETKNNLVIHRLPYQASIRKTDRSLWNKVVTLKNFCVGRIHPELNYYQFKNYIAHLLATKSFDLLLVSSPPLNGLKMTFELGKKFGTPFLADVRDYENNFVLNKHSTVSLITRIKHQLVLFHSSRWLRAAHAVFTVTPPTTDYIKKNTGANAITLMNGYQEDLLWLNETENEQFHISLLGSVYDIPELQEMLDGFKELFKKSFANEITVQFIGSATSPAILEKIKSAIPPQNLVIKPRMTQYEAQKAAAKSQLMLVLGFKNMKGVLGTKPFEYMGMRKMMIQMPGDKDLMEEIIRDCNAGYSPHSIDEFVAVIKNAFFEWKNNGHVKYKGDMEKIKQYSRTEQFKIMIPYIEEAIATKS